MTYHYLSFKVQALGRLGFLLCLLSLFPFSFCWLGWKLFPLLQQIMNCHVVQVTNKSCFVIFSPSHDPRPQFSTDLEESKQYIACSLYVNSIWFDTKAEINHFQTVYKGRRDVVPKHRSSRISKPHGP